MAATERVAGQPKVESLSCIQSPASCVPNPESFSCHCDFDCGQLKVQPSELAVAGVRSLISHKLLPIWHTSAPESPSCVTKFVKVKHKVSRWLENANGLDISSALVASALLMTSWALIFTLARLTALFFPPFVFRLPPHQY